MKITQRPDPEKLHVIAAMLRMWVIDVCLWLSRFWRGRPPRALRLVLRREIAGALRDTRMLVFLLAVSRMRIPVGAPRTRRPLSAPPGFRRARLGGAGVRAFHRGVRLRGVSLTEKLAGLRAIFANLGAAARRMLRHLNARRCGGVALLLAGAIVERVSCVAAVAPAVADTS